MTHLLIHGGAGRMGQRILALAETHAHVASATAAGRKTAFHAADIADKQPHVVIDFSSDEGAQQAVQYAETFDAALLVGTTALSEATLQQIDREAKNRAVMVASNTSVGIATLNHLLTSLTGLLDRQFDVNLVESHHNRKKDKPSGTALTLAETLNTAAGRTVLVAENTHCIRAGGIIGEHEIRFTSDDEEITISHRALSRDLFARGAIDAALWLSKQPPGKYSIAQSLGLEPARPA